MFKANAVPTKLKPFLLTGCIESFTLYPTDCTQCLMITELSMQSSKKRKFQLNYFQMSYFKITLWKFLTLQCQETHPHGTRRDYTEELSPKVAEYYEHVLTDFLWSKLNNGAEAKYKNAFWKFLSSVKCFSSPEVARFTRNTRPWSHIYEFTLVADEMATTASFNKFMEVRNEDTTLLGYIPQDLINPIRTYMNQGED
jgi:hypothetical protein